MFWGFNSKNNYLNKLFTFESVLKVWNICYNVLIFKYKIGRKKVVKWVIYNEFGGILD